MIDELCYPIGGFTRPEIVTQAEFSDYVDEIEKLPYDLRESVAGLNDAQLDTRYREGGWTLRQVVHHLFDSHVNSYTRLKLALTEDNPTIKPYDEETWAELHDAKHAPVDLSLGMLDALHSRWAMTLRSLTPEQRQRTFRHPDSTRPWTIDQNTAMYAWHGKHHVAHITQLRKKMGW
ncbi:MAG: putative metal-dependent hydrolase [Bacteroidota bacterium]|nr:putative metal-dependent hydrolase [Bacteroidota bacterium]MDP4229417.1 putative metal-dependent hydrolase [Bacteroidota bacterium]MDP4236784.1 putative metal-dependent hydrolase [Bacteroidota bacterium]